MINLHVYAHIRVETRLGHPGHVSPGLTGSNLFYKISGLTQILHWITCVGAIGTDQSDGLNMLGGDDGR